MGQANSRRGQYDEHGTFISEGTVAVEERSDDHRAVSNSTTAQLPRPALPGPTPMQQQQAVAAGAVQRTSSTTSSAAGSSSPSSPPLIPAWSRTWSSQCLNIECQKIYNASFTPQATRSCVAVLELDSLRFALWCGGITVRFRVDEATLGRAESVSWGLTSLKPCPGFAPVSSPDSPRIATLRRGQQMSFSANGIASAIGSGGRNSPSAQPNNVDNLVRKPLYLVCGTPSLVQVSVGDILSINITPRDEGQRMFAVTLLHNAATVSTTYLPYNAVAQLQLFPYVTVHPGMTTSLHELTTDSPLFTWRMSQPAADAALTDLDTSIKFNQQTPPSNMNTPSYSDFVGTAHFTEGKHKWTVMLQNQGPNAVSHAFVGLVHAQLESVVTTSQAAQLNVAGASMFARLPATGATPGPSSAGAGPSTSGSVVHRMGTDLPMEAPKSGRWGVWVKLSPAGGHASANAGLQPPNDGMVHVVEAQQRTWITVELDMDTGFVRFYKDGSPVSQHGFNSNTPALAPVVSFLQCPQVCQASLVNLVKLRQLDLDWDQQKCSGDVRIAGRTCSKVSEVYGDYSTVLATQGFISGVHMWLVKVVNLSEPDSVFIGVGRGCMSLDQDPQDLRDRTYYLSNGVIRVAGRRVATNAANFTKGDIVGVVLDADQGEIVFLRNFIEQGRAKGIRGRLFPFVSFDSEADQVQLLGSYTLTLNRAPRQLADMEWDTQGHAPDIELSSNCLTASKTSSTAPSSVKGTILYTGTGTYEFHVILDRLGPDGVWVGVAPPSMDPTRCVGDTACGWALHSDGDRRQCGRETEFTSPFKNGDVLTVTVNLGEGWLKYSRNGTMLGEPFTGIQGPLIAAVTLSGIENKITIQNRPTVLNAGEYTGELRWDESKAGKDLHVIDGLTVTKMSNEGGDYATVLGSLCLASGQHTWNIYINHVEDSNLFIGVTVGGHDLNADPQEMKHRTYYLSNGTIRVAGKLVTRCAEPYAEGDLITVQLDMDNRTIAFLKNGVMQGTGDGLPVSEEVWPYVSLDNIMDSITLHSSNMFADLAHSLRWNATRAARWVLIESEGKVAKLRPNSEQIAAFPGQATIIGLREYSRTEVHSWVIRIEQAASLPVSNFVVGIAPPTMDLSNSIGEQGCGIGMDLYGYIYLNGQYFHVTSASWQAAAKPLKGSSVKHRARGPPILSFRDGKCEITITLDLKESSMRFASEGRTIATIAGIIGPVNAAVTLTSAAQSVTLLPGPVGQSEQTNEELVNILKAKSITMSDHLEAAVLALPRDVFVPRDRLREAYRDQKVSIRMSDGSTFTMAAPSFMVAAFDKLALAPGNSVLDVGCGTGYTTCLAACLVGEQGTVHGIECVSSRLEAARNNLKSLKDRLGTVSMIHLEALGDIQKAVAAVKLLLVNVLVPDCTEGSTYDAIYCDCSLSDEDLPSFLSLLKPNGRMIAVVEDEMVLITRGEKIHDFVREVVIKANGEFSDLEDPTPWEVQEAIDRIKNRERRNGRDMAHKELGDKELYKYSEMERRCLAAVARVKELEGRLEDASKAMETARLQGWTPRTGSMDDVKGPVRDATRKSPRLSPRTRLAPSPVRTPTRSGPLPTSTAIVDSDWKSFTPAMEATRSRSSARDTESDPMTIDELSSHPPYVMDDDPMVVPLLPLDQVLRAVSGAAAEAPTTSSGYKLYSGVWQGVRARVWQVPVHRSLHGLELRTEISRFVVHHPNVATLFGIALQLDGSESEGAFMWLVEESYGDALLEGLIEKGLIPWQAMHTIASDVARALAHCQQLRTCTSDTHHTGEATMAGHHNMPVCSVLTPSTVMATPSQGGTAAKVSLLPSLLRHMEKTRMLLPSAAAELHANLYNMTMHHAHPDVSLTPGGAESASNCFHAFGVILLQLLTEQPASALLGCVRAALARGSLVSMVPKVPFNEPAATYSRGVAELALRAVGGQLDSFELEVVAQLDTLQQLNTSISSGWMDWGVLEEMLITPLQQGREPDSSSRRWVRQDFKTRRKHFMEEVAKLAAEGPVHNIEIRRIRCLKDSVTAFAAKGGSVWRQPLKVTFIGEQGMDSGGVTREWFSSLCTAISKGSPDLFWLNQTSQQLYVNPLATSPSHLKKFQFVGLLVAKALLESAARTRELGSITLNINFCEPFWKLLLGQSLNLVDLQSLDAMEFQSLMHIVKSEDLDTWLFETFVWNFQHPNGMNAPELHDGPILGGPGTSPFSHCNDANSTAISLKPGGTHIRVTAANRREYVLLKANKMLLGAVEAQMGAVMDAFYSLIPRELVEKYQFTAAELKLMVCGEQQIDVADLKKACKYDDGYTGKEEVINWFWTVVEQYDDYHRRRLLQFWSGIDGMPVEGFSSMEPGWHMVAVERMYDRNDRTARLPVAHTCFRQLDLPRYNSQQELLDKLTTAITAGQGYMALS